MVKRPQRRRPVTFDTDLARSDDQQGSPRARSGSSTWTEKVGRAAPEKTTNNRFLRLVDLPQCERNRQSDDIQNATSRPAERARSPSGIASAYTSTRDATSTATPAPT